MKQQPLFFSCLNNSTTSLTCSLGQNIKKEVRYASCDVLVFLWSFTDTASNTDTFMTCWTLSIICRFKNISFMSLDT